MKKVMVYAYTKINFGDDLFIKILCDRYPNVKFKIYTYKEYRKILKSCKNIKVLSNSNFFSKITNKIGLLIKKTNLYENILAKTCDICVYIGGSLFIQDTEKWEDYYNYMLDRKQKNIPFFLLGANFGPYTDKNYYLKFKELFSTYEDICFREKKTYDMFKDLKNVRLAKDIVFTLKKLPNSIEKRELTISVINLDNRKKLLKYKNDYIKAILDIINFYLDNNYRINLVSFCKMEGDEEAVNEIYNLIDNNKKMVNKVYYRGNIDEIIKIFCNSKLIIATRFHAMILGWICNKVTYPIIYSDKMQNVIDDINFLGNSIRIENIREFNIATCINYMESNYIINLEDSIKNANLQFLNLDKLLKK